jgi:hypothetical protein
MWMTKFDKYAGLFADGGSFNIPANLTAEDLARSDRPGFVIRRPDLIA